jgi:hypothetical protein
VALQYQSVILWVMKRNFSRIVIVDQYSVSVYVKKICHENINSYKQISAEINELKFMEELLHHISKSYSV